MDGCMVISLSHRVLLLFWRGGGVSRRLNDRPCLQQRSVLSVVSVEEKLMSESQLPSEII